MQAQDNPYLAYLPHIATMWTADVPDQSWRRVDGTLVFADVSGFTPLTERLARRGKVGAEELTDVLNDVFTRLLDVAASYGGDLLKFGGDALLLLFTGPGHESRAATAAHGLLTALRPFRRFRTPGGVVSLSMSIGMDSGPVHLFLVGGSSRELLVAGDVASSTVLMEHAADGGQVLAGPGAAGALRPDLLRAGPDGGSFVTVAPGARRAPLVDAPLSAAAAQGLVPTALRDHLAQPSAYGEHRFVGLSFLQFRGVDALLRGSGPDAVAAALTDVVATAQRACEQYGVTFLATDVDSDGGKILFVAGAPTASADDPDRLLHALLASVRVEVPLGLRAGANLGRAFGVDVGSPTRRTYAVMGDATNLAARVMGRARNGQVVATETLMERTRDRFRARRLEPFMVKGKSQPVHAAVVGPPSGHRRQRHAAELPFIGRREEKARLVEGLRKARAGAGTRFRLVGEPGLGKSTLLRQTAARATGFARVTVEGGQYAVNSPYFCMRAALRALVGVSLHAHEDEVVAALVAAVRRVAPHLERWLPLLALPWGCALPDNATTEQLDPRHRRQRQHALLTELLHALVPAPALVVVEDGHWVDEASADLLGQLVADVESRPWCVIVTRRPVPGGFAADDADGWTDMRLTAISAAEISSALQDAALTALPPAAREEVARRCGGNPLFLHELVAAVARGEDVASLPTSVEGVLAAGIDELLRTDRELLRVASVLGARFRPDLLADVLAAADGVTFSRDRLPRYLHLDGDGLLRFEHALIRDVAYESLPFRRRRHLHQQAGLVLEGAGTSRRDEVIELLSMHFHLAGDHARAWTYARSAGERAMASMAATEAAVHLQRAVDAASHLDVTSVEVAGVAEQLGDALEICGRYDDAARALQHATRECTDALARARLLRKQGRVRERASRYSDALRWYTRAEHLLDRLPADSTAALRAELRMSYAAARLAQGRYRDAVPLLETAIAEAERLADLDTLAHAYYLLDWALTDLGSPERHHVRDLALPIYERTGNLVGQGFALNNLGVDAYWEGRWDDAVDCYQRVRQVCARSGDVLTDATVLNNIGEIQSDRGEYDDAERSFRDALAIILAGLTFPVGVAIITSNLGRLATRRGDFAAAKPLLAEANERFAAIGSDALACEVEAREAERLLLLGDLAGAVDLARRATRRANDIAGLRVVVVQLERVTALARAVSGDLAGARAKLAATREMAAVEDARYEVAMTTYVEAAVARACGDPAAEALGISAAALLDRLGILRTPPALDRLLGELTSAVWLPAQRASVLDLRAVAQPQTAP